MNAFEMRASTGLASVYALRMFGLFLILPLFSLYASELAGGDDKFLVGLALGAYGLAQAILQLPFGVLSDRFGRKKIIYVGLVIFALGSLIAALAQDILWLILGRVVQGAGAIAAVVTALLADLTREENRTRAMAMVGMSIGLTFSASLVVAPVLMRWMGVSGIFVLTAVLCVLGMLVVKFWVPDPPIQRFHADAASALELVPQVFKNGELLRLNFGIFALHAAQMAMFIILPFVLLERVGLDKSAHWQVYLPVVLLGFFLMIPAIIFGEKKAKLKPIFLAGIALMAVAQLGMAFFLRDLSSILLILAAYFVAFNLLEATLPSLISKIAPVRAKGTAMGVYNTAQSLGVFLGGAVGGWFYAHFGETLTFLACVFLMLLWLLLAASMRAPKAVKSALFPLSEICLLQRWDNDAELLQRTLQNIDGVEEVVVSRADGQIYMKVLQHGWDEARTRALLGIDSQA